MQMQLLVLGVHVFVLGVPHIEYKDYLIFT